jgi:demethylmenaquinone methyltransferase / 2-methoxy-6-polyprenyl-1,4-benzoquinol methylase
MKIMSVSIFADVLLAIIKIFYICHLNKIVSMVEEEKIRKKKWRPLEKMFHEVPERYDLLNRIITWGQDERWRRKAARECMEGDPETVLDLCTGTGDLALRMVRIGEKSVKIHALDYSEPMLVVARKKALKKDLARIDFIQGDAAKMPYAEASFDSVGISFAFRNLTYKNPDRVKFLAEIFRILKEHGKFVIIESSQPGNRLFKVLFRIYLRIFVGGLGGIISGHKGAYKYLAASAMNFYTPDDVRDMLIKTGFTQVKHKSLMGGVAGLTVATK